MLSMLACVSMSAHHPPSQLIINLTHTIDQKQIHWTTLAKADSKFDSNIIWKWGNLNKEPK